MAANQGQSLLDRLPDPLVRDIVAGRSLPIVGAGLSADASMPDGARLPLWRELGAALARQVPGEDAGGDPIDVVSAYAQEYGRARLIEELRTQLRHGIARPHPAQLEFCRLPFDIVCTTNWDTLLERAYELVDRSYYVIVEEQQLSIGVDPKTVTLLKLHGDLDHPHRLVATEADYDRFLSANPLLITYLANLLITRTPLFIGFSVDDADFRQIMAVVSERLGRLTRVGYALRHGVTSREKSRFDRRGIRCIDIA